MIWHVRDITLDDDRFELRRAGRRVRIAPKPLAVLLYLARRHPASVDGQELRRYLWPDVHVTPGSLARAIRDARRAIGERADEGSLIRTVRGRGYALAVPPTGDAAARGGTIVSDGVPFVGRGAELKILERALARTAMGRGCIVFVSGEPGIGKTSLTTEFVARSRHRDVLTVRGTCRQDAGAPPLWPWPEVVDGVVRHGGEGVLRALGPAARDLVLLLRTRGDPNVAPGSATARGGQARHFRLRQAVTTLFRRVAGGGTLVVLLEDAHFADAEAIRLLRFLGRVIADVPIVIMTSFRTAGAAHNAALEAACAELTALPHGVPELRLEGWTPDEIAAYVSAMTGTPPSSALVRHLHRTTAGNPLFVRALLPTLDADQPTWPDEVPVPPAVVHVLHQQWRRLSRQTRHILEAAAIIGGEGPIRLLAGVCRCDYRTILETIAEARAQHLVVRVGDDRFRFTRDLIRDAVRQNLPRGRRADLERRIAAARDVIAGPSSLTVVGGRSAPTRDRRRSSDGHRTVSARPLGLLTVRG